MTPSEPDRHPERDRRDAESGRLMRRQGVRLVAVLGAVLGLLGCLLAVALYFAAR